LPDRPKDATWLRADERDWINNRLTEEQVAKTATDQPRMKLVLRHILIVVMLTLGLFFTYSGGYAFWFFEPTMLQRLTGWSVQRVSWMGPIVFGAGLAGMLFFGWSSDRMRERRWHFAIPQLTAAVALGVWFFLPQSNVALVLIFSLVGFGTIAYLPAFWALPSAFLSSSAAAAAAGFINCMASIGGYFGPKIFGELSQRTGSFNTGFILMIASFVVASVLVLVCPRENLGRGSVARL